MLRHSTKILMRNQNLLNIKKMSSEVKSSLKDLQTKPMEKFHTNDNMQDKVRLLSYTAISKYNEVIGFAEIDQAYNKVTVLQVRVQSLDFGEFYHFFSFQGIVAQHSKRTNGGSTSDFKHS